MKSKSFQHGIQTVKSVGDEIRQVVEAQMRGSALAMAHELFNQEIERLCGPAFSRKSPDQCHRAGSDPGSILCHGQRVELKKPRVKKANESVELETYSALQNYDLLCESVKKQMIAGVSTRDYDGVVEEISGGVGLSKSTVSEAFVRASKNSLEMLNARDLGQYNFAAIMVDGIGFGDRTVVAALGITDVGQKIILGIREGETENWELTRDLFESLTARGLKHDHHILFIIDGGKALKKAIRKVFGNSPIQRCVRHKERNIISYLPEDRHIEFRRRWKKLHGLSDYATAKNEYNDLVFWIGQISAAALQSLEEADLETLTVTKLNVPPSLKKSLLSTNPIESAFSIQKPKLARVKNWRSGPDQVLRWAATTALESEKRFHRIPGFIYLPKLIESLKTFAIENKTEVA
jgi:transposase-like protein